MRIFRENLIYFCGGGWRNKSRLLKRPLRLLVRLCFLPYGLARAALLIPKPLVFRQITYIVTTKCTLSCHKCANLIEYYGAARKPAYTVPAARCIADFDTLFAALDYVYELNVIGGEPFAHKQLGQILEHFVRQAKLKSVSVTTNGTIVPDDELASVLRHPKIIVNISDYGADSSNINALIAWLCRHGVNYNHNKISYWHDNGEMTPRGRDRDTLKRVYYSCRTTACVSFLDGKLHPCPRSAHGMDLGLIPDTPKDYVDVTGRSEAENRRDIINLRLRSFAIAACDYCDNAWVFPMVKIPPGEQKRVQLAREGQHCD